MLRGVDEESDPKLTSEKLTKDKSKKSVVELTKHKNLVEIARSLAEVNPGVKQLNGVKGVYIKEIFSLSNMFSWNTSNIFEIHEADENGNQLNEDSSPILYSVAKLNLECCSNCGSSDMAITTKLDDAGSDGPFLLMSLDQKCCGSSQCNIYINDSGNSSYIGTIYQSCSKRIELDNNYVKTFQISKPCCNCSTTQIVYDAYDIEGNSANLTQVSNCCSCDNPFNYKLGFPPNYNQDQNALVLCMTIFLGFQNYQDRENQKNQSSS